MVQKIDLYTFWEDNVHELHISPWKRCRIEHFRSNFLPRKNWERLQNKEMVCIVSKGNSQTIEEDVSKCSGVLKGELQDIIIQRMHNYLLENIGEIKEEFVSV